MPTKSKTKPKRPAKAKRTREAKIDEEDEESFPASDPPAFMGGKSAIGAPPGRSTPRPGKAKRKAKR